MSCASSSSRVLVTYRASFQLGSSGCKQKQSSLKLVTISIVLLVTFTFVAAQKDKCDPKVCSNGRCDEKGGLCVCDNCWSGQQCQQFVDLHQPHFPTTKHSKVYLSGHHLTISKPIFVVKAVDEDLASTCGNRKPCSCADIAYKLITGDADIFALNQTSGEVSIKNTKKLTTGGEYSLAVKALPAKGLQTEEQNVEDDDDENVFRLTVFVEEELGRFKRQLQSSPSTRKKNTKNTADQSAFKNVESFATSFGLRTVAGEVNSLQVGSSIHYRLEIALPRATIDLFLEIYTKDSHTGNKSYPALSLYNFTIPHRVSGIAFATPEPQFFLSNKSRNVYDRMMIDFGAIKNTGPDRNMLTIYFSVVLTRKPGKSETKHTVMIGGEYGKGTLVWVAQSQITTAALSQSEDQVHLGVELAEAPERLALDSAALYRLNANLEFRSDQLRVEVSKPSFEYEPDNILSLGRVSVAKFGKNYLAIPNNSSHYASERSKTVSQLSFSRSVLDMGVVTNIGEKSRSFSNNPENALTFEFPVYALNYAENLNKNVSFTVRILIGSKTVWSRLINASIAERRAERSTAKMIASTGAFTSYNVSKGGLVQLLVKSDFADSGAGSSNFVDYALQVEVPFAGRTTPLFVPCAARFINERAGFNVPYLSAGSVRPVEVMASEGGGNRQFSFNFGRIHFLNQRTTTAAVSGSSTALTANVAGGGVVNEENAVYAEITFRVPFHQEIEEGTVLNAAVKSFSGSKSSKVAIAQPEVTVYLENKTTSGQMEVTTNRSVPWEELIVDGGVAFNVEVDFESNAAFRDFELTVQRGEATEDDAEQQLLLKKLPPLKICKLALVKVSATDLPCTCVQMDAINENRTTYGSIGSGDKVTTGVRDKATLSTGPISVLNTGLPGEEGEEGESFSNVITSATTYRKRMMANVALMINGGAEAIPEGATYPVTVGVKANGETVWSKTLNFSIASSYSLSDLGIRSMAPKLRLSMVDATLPGGYISPGYTTNIRLQVIIAPNSIGPLTVEVLSGDESAEELSVCGLWIARIGDNMPCVNEAKKANYDSTTASMSNNNAAARMTFKSVTNFGSTVRRSATDEERANTLEFIAMVRVSETAKSNKTLRVVVTYGLQLSERLEQELVLPINATDAKLPTEFEKPKLFTLKPADDSNVTHAGVAKLLYFDIELKPNSQVPLTILMDSSSEFKVCSAAFVKIGRNYPCYSAGGALKVSQGKFELGMICNTFLYRESPADNLMRFAVALRPNGNVLPDRTFAVRTIAYTGPTPYSKNELLLSVATNSTVNSTTEKGGKSGEQNTNTNPPPTTTTPSSTIATSMAKGATVHAASSIEGGSDPVNIRTALRIRQQKWVPFNVRIPPYTTGALSLHLQGDADESRAILVLHDLKVVAGGANIPCPLDNGVTPAVMNFNSSVATSQRNIITASLGVFANFGFSHLLATKGGTGSPNETSDKLADDFLRLEVLVELTDHPSIVEDGSYRIAITTYYGPPPSAAVRTGQIKLTPVLQGEPGPKIDVAIKLKKKMEVLDRGDTFTMTATLRHLPESTSEPINPVLRLFTADFIEVIRVESASSKELPTLLNTTDSRTTDILFPWILFTDEIVVNFTISVDPNNIRGYGRPEAVLITPYRVLCEHYRTENSGAKTPCSALKHLHFNTKSSECSGPLGMESGEIPDHRITASSAISADYAPTNARPSSAQFWSPALRSGRTEYLQVDFGRRTRVVKIGYKSIRGLRRVATFHLLYSDDGRVWRTAANRSQLVYHGEDGESVVKRPVEAKMYRFVIDQIESSSSKGKSSYVSVRLEFHGCYLEEAVASNETTTKWKTHFSDDPTVINRHIAVDPYTHVIYFCDATLDGHQMCYYSGNSGAQWAILGRSIDSVEGFELATGKFFAVDYQRPAYFSSGDGHLWTPVDFEQFNATVSHSKFHRKIVIPQLHRDDIRKLDIRMGNWRANYDGLYYDDAPNAKAYWKNCCGLD